VVSADLDGDRLTLEQQVCFTLAVAAREVVSLYRPLLEPLGLTHPQYLVMVTLWQTPQPASIRQLSTLLKLEAPTLSPLLKRLEAAGLVQRHRDPTDERSLQITLTDRGWNLRASAQEVPAAIIQRLGMSIEELETLQDILTDVIQHAKTPTQAAPAQPEPDLAAGPASAPRNDIGSSQKRRR
jgi:MarR family transcriptional regulator, organic hydroperoxide resistance regulator